MKDKTTTISSATKVTGGIAFLFVFILNVMLLVQKSDNISNLTLAALKAYAQTGSEGGENVGDNCIELRDYDSSYIQTMRTPCCQVETTIYTTYNVYYFGEGCPTTIGTVTDEEISYTGTNCCA